MVRPGDPLNHTEVYLQMSLRGILDVVSFLNKLCFIDNIRSRQEGYVFSFLWKLRPCAKDFFFCCGCNSYLNK